MARAKTSMHRYHPVNRGNRSGGGYEYTNVDRRGAKLTTETDREQALWWTATMAGTAITGAVIIGAGVWASRDSPQVLSRESRWGVGTTTTVRGRPPIERYYSPSVADDLHEANSYFETEVRRLGLDETDCVEVAAKLQQALWLLYEPTYERWVKYQEERRRGSTSWFPSDPAKRQENLSFFGSMLAGARLDPKAQVILLYRRGEKVGTSPRRPKAGKTDDDSDVLDTPGIDRVTAIEVIYKTEMRDRQDQLQPAVIGLILGTSARQSDWRILGRKVYEGPETLWLFGLL